MKIEHIIYVFLPPKTSQRNVKDAPSGNGPTTLVKDAPDSFVITIFWGGTANKIITHILI